MRSIILFFLILILIFITIRCNNESSDPVPVSILEVFAITDQAGIKFLEFAEQTGGDPIEALDLTRNWVLTQETVEDAIIQDNTYLRILLKSGLRTTFHYDEIDENGISLTRGGGKGTLARLSLKDNEKGCSNEITNKNVLIFASAFTEFYGSGDYLDSNIGKIYTDADEDFKVTILKDGECTVDVLNTFGDYGMVIVDTHGEPDAFLLGYILSVDTIDKPDTEEEARNLVIDQFGNEILEMLLAGDLGYHDGFRIRTGVPDWYLESVAWAGEKQTLWTTSKYLNSLGEWPGTVIMGNMCYSGCNKVANPALYSSPLIREAFLNRKLISYYGYAMDDDSSDAVSNDFCKLMEDSLSRALTFEGDSTGIAHLKENGMEFNDIYSNGLMKFKHFNADNYCFVKCGKELTDIRDGKKYKTVCIGDQVWMAENLNFEVPVSECYDYQEANCSEFGNLYQWGMVMNGEASSENVPSGVRGICPEGWHVPSNAEWQILVDALGGDLLAGGALKAAEGWESPNTGGDNSSGFTALAGGSATFNYINFLGKGTQASFWTATEVSPDDMKAYQRTLLHNSAEVRQGPRPRNDGLSLRCVKD
jgi:uncharacterized protein (TIGR02145 family)